MRSHFLFFLLFTSMFALPSQASWDKQHETLGNGNMLAAVAAGSGENAVAAGVEAQMGSSKPVILHTKDGATWTKTPAPTEFSLITTLSMPDAQTVYGGGLGLYKSGNGGQSFTAINVDTGGGPFDFLSVTQVYAVDPVHAFGVSGSKIYWTPNSLQWEATETGVQASFTSVYFIDSQNGWVAGGEYEEIVEEDPFSGEETVVGNNYLPKGIVMRTGDGGKTFEPLVVGAEDYFRSVSFINANIGLAVAGYNNNPVYIKRTTDGGKTWADIDVPLPPENMVWMHLSKIVMTSPIEGWAAGCVGWEGSGLDNMGNKAVILHTMDGGVSWSFDPEGEAAGAYLDIDFAGAHWGWAVGTGQQVMFYNDGTPWEEPIEPGDDVTEQPYDDVLGPGDQDVFTWGNVFGTFGEEVLVGQQSGPPGTSVPINVGPGEGECETETQGTGCSAGGSSGSPWLLLLLTAGLWALARKRAAGCMAVVLLMACSGGEKTVEVCPDASAVAPLPEVVAQTDAGGADGAQPSGEFSCVLAAGAAPMEFGGLSGRVVDAGDQVVFVRAREDGGSDLYLATSDGAQVRALTGFNDPEVQVLAPSWSPDRKYVAFSSNFRYRFNAKRFNLFVVSADGSVCYQVTPDIEAARLKGSGELTATLTGFFKYSSGGTVAVPVSDATIAFPGGTEAVLSGPGGEFSVKAPPGEGKLVMRGEVNGLQVVGVAEYEAEAGKSVELEATIGHVEAENSFSAASWSFDGASAFVFVKGGLDHLAAVDMNSGEAQPVMDKEEDSVAVFTPFPFADRALVSWKSAPEAYQIYAPYNEVEPLYEFTFEGQGVDAYVTISPMHFVAAFQGEKLKILGADAGGDLKVEEISAGGLKGALPAQLDWSPDGTRIIVAVAGAGGTDRGSSPRRPAPGRRT